MQLMIELWYCGQWNWICKMLEYSEDVSSYLIYFLLLKNNNKIGLLNGTFIF